MSLNKEDLLAISQLLDTKLMPIQSDVQGMKAEIQGLKAEQQEMKAEIQGLKAEQQEMKAEIQGLKAEQKEMKAEIQGLKAEIQGLKAEQQEMKAEIQGLKAEQQRINLIIENEIRPDIKALAENYMPAAKKYEKATADMEGMQMDMDVMKHVVAEHNEKLKRISLIL